MNKRILVLAISVLCFQMAGFSQTRVGLSAGVSVANMKGRVDGDGKAGVMASLVLDVPMCKKKNFSFYPTLSYVQKGVVEPHPEGTLIDKQYIATRYMELATNVIYNIPGEKTTFYLGAGPSADFNLPSKRVSITDGDKVTTDLLMGSTPENEMRGVDYGLNFMGGFRTASGFFFNLNYNKGIRNLVPLEATGSLKNQYIGIQLGVFLNNGKPSK
ncbi:MAG: outer membrane beta-barrel protein [Chitinophagaceae bacterium]